MTMQHDQQVSSVLKRTVQSVLTRGLNDPRVRGLITVTDVRISPDGTQALVLVSIQPEDQAELTMHGLHHAAPHIRYKVARFAKLRRMPQMTFKLDRSLKKQAEVLAAINRGRRRDAERTEAVEEPRDTAPESPERESME
ncbi:MAG: 30S ribosome-binding factor RbfA [Planctomycetota bacterium]|jgi:ribosome-binding factor A